FALIFHSYAAPRHLHSFPTRRSSDLVRARRWRNGLPPASLHRLGRQRWSVVLQLRQLLHRHHCASAGWFRHREQPPGELGRRNQDRKSTRLNSSHLVISYAVFCLKKK